MVMFFIITGQANLSNFFVLPTAASLPAQRSNNKWNKERQKMQSRAKDQAESLITRYPSSRIATKQPHSPRSSFFISNGKNRKSSRRELLLLRILLCLLINKHFAPEESWHESTTSSSQPPPVSNQVARERYKCLLLHPLWGTLSLGSSAERKDTWRSFSLIRCQWDKKSEKNLEQKRIKNYSSSPFKSNLGWSKFEAFHMFNFIFCLPAYITINWTR